MKLTHLSLFSGIGGLDLAAEMADFETVGQCEYADYPTKVLEKHWPNVPRWRDIRTLTKESFYERTGLHTVDAISGGFPCQPFSLAGKHRGKKDDRYLWPEMQRVISELHPTWVIGENVTGIVSLALDQVLSDLENIGYTCQSFAIPAAGVDAPHRRERIAILAHSVSQHVETPQKHKYEKSPPGGAKSSGGCKDVPHPNGCRLPRNQWREYVKQFADSSWWAAEPSVGRVANGIPNRVDRIRCLGNAVVPHQFYPFFKYIHDIEEARQ